MNRQILNVTACFTVLISAAWARADSYSDAVLATPGLQAFYRLNEHPTEIGDPLINSANPGVVGGVWGNENANPDALPLSGEEGPNSNHGFAGLDGTNVAAMFGGNAADDNGDGQAGDNVADQLDLGDGDEWDNELATIAFFMRATTDGNDSRIFTTAPSAGHTFRLVYGSSPDYGAMIVITNPDNVDSSASVVTSGSVFSDDLWHHLVVIRNGDVAADAKFYLDGVDISGGFIDPVDSFGASDNTARIGARHGNDNFGWGAYTGLLDEFAYWDRALTADEAVALYTAAIGGGGGLRGDFNDDGLLDAADIDELTRQSAGGSNPATYDLNADTFVDAGDIQVWARDLVGTWIGDADLNGEFNSGDLVRVLAAGTYETDTDAVWSTGDFTGDGRTTTGDLVAALSDGGYEQGPRAAVSAVPEPTSMWLLLAGSLALCRRSRRATVSAR